MIMTTATINRIISIPNDNCILTTCSGCRLGSIIFTIDRIIPTANFDTIISPASVQSIISFAAIQKVISGAAVDRIIVDATMNGCTT